MRLILSFLLALAAAFSLQAQSTKKIAVVGLVHSHVWGHLERMVKTKPADLVGIAEKEAELVAEAKQLGAPASIFFDDYTKMLDQTKPDIVWAFVENNRHLEIVRACAPRKIHVMFEKPLSSTYAEAKEIAKLARQHGIQVMTNYQMAWWPANHAAKQIADSGELGQVWRIRGIVGNGGPSRGTGRSKYFFDWLTDPVKGGGGALVDFGCYNALWSLWYMGRPEKVYGHTNQLRPSAIPKVEDNATMILSYKNGVGLFEGSWDLPRSFQDLEVLGLQGSVNMRNGSVIVRKGSRERNVELTPLPPEQAEPIRFMIQAIDSGKPIEGLTAIDINVGVMEILDALKQSVRTGAAVRLPLP